MNRIALFILALTMIAGLALGQGPVYHQSDLWTLPYEDLSDILRRYPGMYPMDYGDIGQPMLFRPWNLNPWELRVDRDGIPQNRKMDGLYDPNLQPGSELDSVGYDFLRYGGAGRFSLITRHLPVDSPYTELQIREGEYGYGTVDFAQGEKIYKSATLELTGRLVFYNGEKDITYPHNGPPTGFPLTSSSRFRRVRGRFGFDLGSRWRVETTYAGSSVNSRTFLALLANDTSYYSERRDGIISIEEKDSARTALSPSLKLYARQDREQWGAPFKDREFTKGAILEEHAALPDQRFSFRQLGTLSTEEFPGFPLRHELWLELHANDSVGLGIGAVNVFGSLRRESNWGDSIPSEHKMLSGLGFEFTSNPYENFTLHGGSQYTEDIVPLAWRFGQYLIRSRPLLIAQEFTSNPNDTIVYRFGRPPVGGITGQIVDHYIKSDLGVRWDVNSGFVDVTAMVLDLTGSYHSQFTQNSGSSLVYLDSAKVHHGPTPFGLSVAGSLPLKYGFRLEGSSFAEWSPKNLSSYIDSRAYVRLYFERAFFSTPLIIRAHISDEFFGQRNAFSNVNTGQTIGPNNIIGLRISATIKGVTAIWGTENLLDQPYAILPGYKMIGKEEYLGFLVRLWL